MILLIGGSHLYVRGLDTDRRQPVQILPDLQPEIREIVPEQATGWTGAAHIRHRRRRLQRHDEGSQAPVYRHQRSVEYFISPILVSASMHLF